MPQRLRSASRRWLRQAGAAWLGLVWLLGAHAAPGTERQIAITIDDVPFTSSTPMAIDEALALNQRLLQGLQKQRVRAVGFVSEDRLLVPGAVDQGITILSAWLDAGMELGNHNHGHLGLWRHSLAEVQDAVVKGEVFTRWLTSTRQQPLRYYRHPYTQTGRNEAERQAFEAFLAARGYTVAPFTIEHDDYVFACVYDRAAGPDAPATRQAVVADYLEHLARSVATFETMSLELFGRHVPQVLLMHANRLNADTIGQTLAALRGMGYRFIALDEALRDPAYRSPAAASGRFGPSWLARWARAAATPLSVYGQAEVPARTARWHEAWCR